MKKVLALLLALTMCLGVVLMTGCSKIAKDDPAQKGAELEFYMGKKVMNLDPAVSYTDDNAAKILSLIFEGLTTIDENGKLKKALAKDWEIIEDEKTGKEKLEITINDTYWSDGSVVQANDVIYAWRRILDPDFDSTAASMLYCIKGAKAAKAGEISIYDIGLYATTTTKFIVEFEDGADIDEFLYNTASLALVPLRENKVVSYPDTWSRSATDLSCNGPFRVKKFSEDPTEIVILERSKYYYLNQEVNTEAIDKFVTPYRITIRYDLPIDKQIVSTTDETDVYDLFNKQVFYIADMTAATAGAYSGVQVEKEASTFAFYFNVASDAFEEQVIRKAFSMALDRNAVAALVGLETEPATGLLNDKVYNTGKKTSFRDAGGDVLSAAGNIEGAKQLLADNGIDPFDYDDLYLVVRKDDKNDSYQSAQMGYKSNEYAIAEYAQSVWNQLGFNVVINSLGAADYEAAYKSGDYEIIGMDFQALSTYPIYNLAAFSYEYSGDAVPVKDKKNNAVVGYQNEEYDALIESAFAETDADKRAEILHEAEKLLLEDAAVCPVIFNTNAYVVSGELSKVKTNYWGAQTFTKAELKDYVQYLESVRNNADVE